MKTDFDTIVALCTAQGKGGIAVIRVSGEKAQEIAEKITGKPLKPRYATYLPFKNEEGHFLDEGIALFFPNPHSFTGEDILELHGHGGPIVVDLLIQHIVTLGARLARPGEFSERAFLNDKIDLIQAEAIADLIDASSKEAVQSALRSLQGDFSKKIDELVELVIQLRLYVEAAIDFVDEDIQFLTSDSVLKRLDHILQTVEHLFSIAKEGALLREGLNVVIVGQPNVGKSSLLNHLSGKESAIVTPIAGTTRDVLREHIHLEGIPLHIIDTAGLRESDDIIEQEGMRRTHLEAARADLILWVTDINKPIEPLPISSQGIPTITIRNKIDLISATPSVSIEAHDTIVSLSAKTGLGIDLLKTEIKTIVGLKNHQEGVFSARRRHLEALKRAKVLLENGKEQLLQFQAGDLLAEDLRLAQLALNEIKGEFSSDDLLGRIFSSFCIGK